MVPSLATALAWSVVLVTPLLWVGTVLLLRLYRAAPDNGVIRAQLLSTEFAATVVTVFGLIFLSNDMKPPALSLPETQIITRLAILSLAIPVIYWIALYRRALR